MMLAWLTWTRKDKYWVWKKKWEVGSNWIKICFEMCIMLWLASLNCIYLVVVYNKLYIIYCWVFLTLLTALKIFTLAKLLTPNKH
jgi:hypothetical protein